MTASRLAHATTSPARTGGDDRPRRTPCADRPDIYDTLHARFGVDPEAVEAAQNTCATCLLRYPDLARACLDGAKGEMWREWVLGERVRRTPKPVTKSVGKWAERNAARREDLRDLIAAGATVADVCERFGMNRKSMQKWCSRHAREEWAELNAGGASNQYVQRGIGEISLRSRARGAAA